MSIEFFLGVGLGLLGITAYYIWQSVKRIRELERICAESYQVMAILADEAGRFNDLAVSQALTNLSTTYVLHDDVLPFPCNVGEPNA
jgi:hypothetical protein